MIANDGIRWSNPDKRWFANKEILLLQGIEAFPQVAQGPFVTNSFVDDSLQRHARGGVHLGGNGMHINCALIMDGLWTEIRSTQ